MKSQFIEKVSVTNYNHSCFYLVFVPKEGEVLDIVELLQDPNEEEKLRVYIKSGPFEETIVISSYGQNLNDCSVFRVAENALLLVNNALEVVEKELPFVIESSMEVSNA